MSRETSGIIINDEIFINSSQVVKIDKGVKNFEENITYTINIFMTDNVLPIVLNLNNENDRDVIFNKIVMELYGYNYGHVDF